MIQFRISQRSTQFERVDDRLEVLELQVDLHAFARVSWWSVPVELDERGAQAGRLDIEPRLPGLCWRHCMERRHVRLAALSWVAG